jgi:hypothetical protein
MLKLLLRLAWLKLKKAGGAVSPTAGLGVARALHL